MKTVLLLLALVAPAAIVPGVFAASDPGAELTHYNVVWDSPSADARGSMPIGNGDLGANVWVDPSGDLIFFIGKTDAWDENVRLLKLTKVRVKFDPALDVKRKFHWELNLRDGVIEIHDGKMRVRLWVDANHPVVQVDATSLGGRPIAATASLEPWRKEKRSIGNPYDTDNENFSTSFTTLPPFSYPDVILPRAPRQIGWYHRDVVSPWLASLKLQKLEALATTGQDPILNRTFGGIVRGDDFVSVSNTKMKTKEPTKDISLRICALTRITDTPEQWVSAVEKQADDIEKLSVDQRWQAHCRWWNEFWNRSWIFVSGGDSLNLPVNSQPWRIGVASDGSSRFRGEISDPQIIGRALSPEEIAALAAKPHTGATALPKILAKANPGLTNGCTLAAWIKPAAGEAGRILDQCTAGQPDGLTFDAYPGLSLRWIVGKNTMVQRDCLKPGEWQHVAATVDAATGVRRIYLAGKLVKEERGDASPGSVAVTRAYLLQRWINACGGRGAYPIKFNGSIFVVDNPFDADYRRWGGGYWFQNTRLIYWSMLDAGDFDLMKPLFAMYMKALPEREFATKTYYGHDGAFFPETMTFWGCYLDQGILGYGTDRTGKPDGLTDNQYIRRYWQGGIELVAMMLDYYDFTQDKQFRQRTLIPFASPIIAFFDQHWSRGADGKMLFHPSQSLETWWDCTDPTPEIAGLRFVIPRLEKLVNNPELKNAWQKTLDALPPIPFSAGAPKRILPAEKFADQHNSENPELYAVFPYRLFTLADGDAALAIGRNTFDVRQFPENGGWQQNSIQAALLGLTATAQRYVVDSAFRHASGFRFPAMWGPNYDWTPDQDHGTVMMSALQRMLIQYDDGKIYVLPAWPRNWNVNFKLRAPENTVVQGVYRDGKLAELKVSPASRRKDVVIGP